MAGGKKQSTEAAVREIRRRTRREFAPEEKIRIVLEGLDALDCNPGSAEIDPQHLPERAPVDLVNEALQT